MKKEINNKELQNTKFPIQGLERSEQYWADKQYKTYLEIYPHLNKVSDLQLLAELVFMEVLQERYRKAINDHLEEAKKTEKETGKQQSFKTPLYLQEQYKNNLDQILVLKEKLGMFEDKKKLDAYQDIQTIFAKFAIWREKNQGSRKVTCPFCSKIFFLKIRTDKYEEFKFPFFQDKVLCNDKLHKIYKEGRITKEEYADIMGVSSDFPDWLDEKFFEKKRSLESSSENTQS